MKTFQEVKNAYLIGIKGSGMTALAEVLQGMGISVSGSDTSEVFFTDAVLRKHNISFIENFSSDNVPLDADVVIYSTAYTEQNNIEMQEAARRGMVMMSYPQAVGALMNDTFGLAVCGTHGKTTTSALLAETLRFVGEDPTAIVGSRITQWEGNAILGKGKYFVLEADEYQNKLQYYHPFGVILTSLDWDHPDFFPTAESYTKVFTDFVEKIPAQGVLVFCGDSADVANVAKDAHCNQLSYGFLEGNDIRIVNRKVIPGSEDGIKQSFEIIYEEKSLGEFSLQLAGQHNALNAAGVIALSVFLKLDIDKIREGLRLFQGTAKRFEYIGESHGVIVYDDYAHHPEEVKATLRAFRELYPEKRIVTVFHPHTFTRTKALLEDFAQSFDDADKVLLLDIYGSARETAGGVSSDDLVRRINLYFRDKAVYTPTVEDAFQEVVKDIGEGDVLITLGAGNAREVAQVLMKHFD